MPYKPAELRSPDATVAEVMAYRHESARTVFRKIAAGVYTAHKNLDNTLITWESVDADREACLARGRPAGPATGTRRVGRPKKAREAESRLQRAEREAREAEALLERLKSGAKKIAGEPSKTPAAGDGEAPRGTA
jgi:hypothetical protein